MLSTINSLLSVAPDYGKNIVTSLKIMGIGMLAIFVAIGLVFLGILAMNASSKKIKLAREAKQKSAKSDGE